MSWLSGAAVRRLGPLLAAALALPAGLAACGDGEVTSTPAPGRVSSPDSASRGVKETVAEEACRNAQLMVMRRLERSLPEVVWLVTGDVDGASGEASNAVRRALERGEDRLQKPCGGLPEEMSGVQRTVLATAAGPLDAAGLRRLDRAVGHWARTLDAPAPVRSASVLLQRCRDLGTQLSAGYTVGWEPTSRGRRWWVQVAIDSDLSTQVWVDIGGTLWATGLPRNPYARKDGRGGQEVEWGGSSADSLYAQPFTRSTKQVGLPGPSGYLHTSADGRVYGVHPEMFVRHAGQYCSLPVPPLG
jgi:hypothetical protein